MTSLAPSKTRLERAASWLPLLISILSLVLSVTAFRQNRALQARDTAKEVESLLDEAWEQLEVVLGGMRPGDLPAMPRIEKAEKLVNQAARLDSRYPRVLLMRGLCASARNDLDTAMSLFSRALKRDPSYGPAYVNLGNSLIEQGSVDKGVKNLERALELDKENVEALLSLGVVQYRLGDLEASQKSFRKVIEVDPLSQKAHYFLGNSLYAKGDLDGAIEEYRKARDIDPERMPTLYLDLGSALFYNGDYDKAVLELSGAIQRGNTDPRVHSLLKDAQERSSEAQNLLTR